MTIEQLVDQLSEVYTSGTFSILDKETLNECGLDHSDPTDIGVYYDYCTDELSDSESNQLLNFLYEDPHGGWGSVKSWMTLNGYTEVYENDGSGNGLYYGLVVFRKV